MNKSYSTLPESKNAISRRLKVSRYVNRVAFAAALTGGISIGYSSAEEPPAIPNIASLAVMVGAGAATGIDSKKALKKCTTIVKSYSDSQSFTGNPETTVRLSVVEGDLKETTSDDSRASQVFRTRNSAVHAENPIATLGGPYMTGGGGILIGNALNLDVPPAMEDAASKGSYLVGGTVAAVGLSIAVAREIYLRQSESAYLRQLDNIHAAGNLEF